MDEQSIINEKIGFIFDILTHGQMLASEIHFDFSYLNAGSKFPFVRMSIFTRIDCSAVRAEISICSRNVLYNVMEKHLYNFIIIEDPALLTGVCKVFDTFSFCMGPVVSKTTFLKTRDQY